MKPVLDKTRLDGSKVTIAEVAPRHCTPLHDNGAEQLNTHFTDDPSPSVLFHSPVSQAKVGDASGCIVLTCKNEQIPIVSVGSSVTIRNAKVLMYKNHMRLAVDQWGLIEPSAQPLSETVNAANNLSDTEYELVDA